MLPFFWWHNVYDAPYSAAPVDKFTVCAYAREFTSSGVVVYSNTRECARPSFQWLNFRPFRQTAPLEHRVSVWPGGNSFPSKRRCWPLWSWSSSKVIALARSRLINVARAFVQLHESRWYKAPENVTSKARERKTVSILKVWFLRHYFYHKRQCTYIFMG